jgi:hypothetical protein
MAWAWGVGRRSGGKEGEAVNGGARELKREEGREREILLASANDTEGPSIFSSKMSDKLLGHAGPKTYLGSAAGAPRCLLTF